MKALRNLKNFQIKPLDFFIFFFLIILAFSPFFFLAANAKANQVEVKVSGKIIQTFSLSKNQKWTYEKDGEINKIEILNGRVRVYDANCRDQIDVKAGWISSVGQSLVCLPHSLVVTLSHNGTIEQDGKIVDYQ